VLPTIRSRCRLVTLATPAPADVAAFLSAADGVADALAAYAARASQGHIGRARALARDEAPATGAARSSRSRPGSPRSAPA
jgi:DNA polymerase-3 subunit delta'